MSNLQEKAKKFSEKYSNGKHFRDLEFGYENGFSDCQKEYEEKLRWIPVEEKLPDFKGDFSLNIEMKLDNGLILTGYKFKNTNEWLHYDYNHIGHLIQGARFVTHWRYLFY